MAVALLAALAALPPAAAAACPALLAHQVDNILGEKDHIVPPEATAPLIDLVGSPDKHELSLAAGHMGLVVGRTAAKTTVPTILDFLRRRSDELASTAAKEA